MTDRPDVAALAAHRHREATHGDGGFPMPSDIEQALAEALHALYCPRKEPHLGLICSAGFMDPQAIARDAAVGRAVLRLADSVAWTLRGGPDGSNTEAWNTQTGAVGSGDTIPEAIAAALGDDHDLVEPPACSVCFGDDHD